MLEPPPALQIGDFCFSPDSSKDNPLVFIEVPRRRDDQDFAVAASRLEKEPMNAPPRERRKRPFTLEAELSNLPNGVPGSRLIDR